MDFKYNAFISYRHCELDQFAATNLHRKLEKFKLPKFSRALLPEGEKGKIERVFRDEEELPLATNLSDQIEKALSNSDFLIVICTPRLSASKWCQKEIETFMEMHGRERILLVLAEGEPSESFPEIMTYEEVETVDASGNTVKVRKTLEPLAADIRGENNKQRLKAMDIAVIKLAAAMFGLNFDDVRQRHREQKLRKRIRIWSGIAAAVAVFACMCLILLAKINVQKTELQEKYAASQAIAAEELLGYGRRKDAIYATRSVLPKSGDYNAEAYRVLNEAVSPYSTSNSLVPTKVYNCNSAVDEYCVSKDGSFLAVYSDGEISVFDTETGELEVVLEGVEFYNGLSSFAFDGNTGLVYCNEDETRYYELKSGIDSRVASFSGAVICGTNTDVVTIITDEKMIGCSKGECLYSIDIWKIANKIIYSMWCSYSYNDDGSVLTIAANSGMNTTFVLVETETGKIQSSFEQSLNGDAYVTADDYVIYAITENLDVGQSYLYILDKRNGDIISFSKFPHNLVRYLQITDGKLFVRTDNTAILLDTSNFAQVGIAEGCVIPVSSFFVDEKPYIADSNGDIFTLSGEWVYGEAVTRGLFDILPKEKVLCVKYAGGKYFYQFTGADYIVVYEDNSNSLTKSIPQKSFEMEDLFDKTPDAFNEIDKITDVKSQYVRKAIYSSDDTMILLKMTDGSFRIYDKKKHKLIKVLYDMTDGNVDSFVYLEKENIYIVSNYSYSYILDGNLNYIAVVNCICGYEDGSLIIKDCEQYYKVPYVKYSEMIKMADEILGDYEPEEKLIEKYNMTVK